jgi:beta-aspartyl-peptidase (threonine type)
MAFHKNGNIAAETSTTGVTNKKYGRISDTLIIAIETDADNASCNVSAIGHSWYFIRSVGAYDIAVK